MHEIRFRVWNCTEKKMIDADCFTFNETAPLAELFDNENYDFMMFSGMYDVNMKAIYEGDNVCVPYTDPIFNCRLNNTIVYDEIYTVKFKQGSYIIENEDHCFYLFDFVKDNVIAVVGNIYERNVK